MSQKSVEFVIGKAMLDPSFRIALMANSDQALAPFNLTETEKHKIKKMDSEMLENMASTLNKRFGTRKCSPKVHLKAENEK